MKVRGSSYLVPYFVTGYDISGLHAITNPRSVDERSISVEGCRKTTQ